MSLPGLGLQETRNDSSFISSLLDQEEKTLEFYETTTLQNITVCYKFNFCILTFLCPV